MTERLVVIGGDAAGMSAASQARRRRTSDDLIIDVFEMTQRVSYSACGEPYYISGDVPNIEQLIARTPAQFSQQDISVHLGNTVTEIDTDSRTITVLNGRESRVVPFDQLVYATGARPVRPPIEGIDLTGVFHLKTLDDAEAIKAAAAHAKNAVVVGGGYIGLEMAEAFHVRGITTTLVTSGAVVMNRSIDQDLGAIVTAGMRERGIAVRPDHRVNCLADEQGHVRGIQLDGGLLEADIVILALATRPVSELAAEAGIRIGPTGAVAVDNRQRTSVEGIWSAGDCAEALHRITGRPANVHLGTVANKQGRVAGINIGGDEATFPGILGTAITKVLDIEIARTGLSQSEAESAGIEAVTAITESTTMAGYWPESTDMTLKVTAERRTGRLLGAQIVGGRSAGKRIDTLATGIWNEMDGLAFSMMDLSYAPPFSGTWDPVLIAARRAYESAM
ncbi:MAG: FAD-dependent oxidoreductase [Acidimicrobiia bacterium]|nr:FAD-dependent oxidoreductase [Acidimicrobiia bacterium]